MTTDLMNKSWDVYLYCILMACGVGSPSAKGQIKQTFYHFMSNVIKTDCRKEQGKL